MSRYLLYVLLLVSCNLLAQPVITRNNFPSPGNVFEIYEGNSAKRLSDHSGENQVWDLSNLPVTFLETITYSASSESGFSSEFQLSNINYEVSADKGGYTYLDITENQVRYLGFETSSLPDPVVAKYDNEWIMYSLPLRYKNTFTDDFSSTSIVKYEGQTDNNFFKGIYSYEVDGFGTLITPFKTYRNVLRVAITNSGRDSSVRVGDSETTLVNEYTNKKYVWLSADDKSELVSTFDFKTFFLTREMEITSSENLSDVYALSVFPNPVSDRLNIVLENSEAGKFTVFVYDPFGNAVLENSINSKNRSLNFEIPLAAYASGLYYIKIVSENAEWKSKFIKQ